MNKIIFQISLQQGMLWDRVLIPGIWAWVLQLTSVTVTKSWPKQFMKEDTDSFGSQSCRTTSSTSTRLYNPFVSEPSEGCTLRSGVYGGVNIPITNQEQCVTVWERRRKGEREWKIQRHRNRQSWAFPVSARHTQNNRRASYQVPPHSGPQHFTILPPWWPFIHGPVVATIPVHSRVEEVSVILKAQLWKEGIDPMSRLHLRSNACAAT